jgi:hypothetical protein
MMFKTLMLTTALSLAAAPAALAAGMSTTPRLATVVGLPGGEPAPIQVRTLCGESDDDCMPTSATDDDEEDEDQDGDDEDEGEDEARDGGDDDDRERNDGEGDDGGDDA